MGHGGMPFVIHGKHLEELLVGERFLACRGNVASVMGPD